MRGRLLISLLALTAATGWLARPAGGEQISSDAAVAIYGVGNTLAWLTDDGTLHVRDPRGRETTVTESCAARGTTAAPGICTAGVRLGRNRSGADVAVVVRCREETCRLVNRPLNGDLPSRPLRGPLPTGAIVASQWKNRIVVGVLGDGEERGAFVRRDSRWKRIGRGSPRNIEVRDNRVLIDASRDRGDTIEGDLRLVDLARPRRTRTLAYRPDFSYQCRNRGPVCSTYGSSQLTRDYAYLMEYAGEARIGIDRDEATYLCRFNLDDPGDISRWRTPELLGTFAVVGGTLYAAPRPDLNGFLVPGIHRYTPQWEPATKATPIEANGPCGTDPIEE